MDFFFQFRGSGGEYQLRSLRGEAVPVTINARLPMVSPTVAGDDPERFVRLFVEGQREILRYILVLVPDINDADEILRYLHDRFPGMKVGEITDSARFADSPQSTWQQALRRNFGSDATSDGFSTSDFAIRLGLTGQPVRLVPLPVMVV